MKKRLIFITVTLLLALGFLWVSTHAFVVITPESPNEINYTLTDVGSRKSSTFRVTGRAKKIVRRGSYELVARKGETSYVTILHVGGFMSSTESSINLSPEKSRKFVGDNPSGCMYYIGNVLASADCGDLYSQLKLHVPASDKQPTIVISTNPAPTDGIIEGIVTTTQGNIMLLRNSSGTGHTAYPVKSDLSLTESQAMTDLDASKSYGIQPYREGFLVYDLSLNQLLYYPSISSRPSTITIKRSGNKKLSPYAIRVQQNSILVAYSNNPDDAALGRTNDVETSSKPTNKAEVSILVYSGGQTQEYNFKRRVSSFALCGTQKLCLLGTTGQLDVYSIASNKPKLLFSMGAIDRIEPGKEQLIAATKIGLLSLDVDNQKGFLQYSFGEYTLCGLSVDQRGSTLCLSNSAHESSALLVDPTSNNADSIDKKIAKLRQLPEVKHVSIYDKYIYISPNLGEVQYIPRLKVFGYDPAVIKSVNEKIKEQMQAIGIDQNSYKVLSAFDN